MAGFLLAGMIGVRIDLLFGLSSLFYALCFLQAFRLKEIEKLQPKVPYFSLDTLMKNSGTYFPLFLRHTGAVGVWAIFPLYLRELGAGTFWIGVIYAINPAVQFLIMRMLDPFENEKLIPWRCSIPDFRIQGDNARSCHLFYLRFSALQNPGKGCRHEGFLRR
ncbi:hypothetical protein [Methanosarcina sp. WH1]|uniref:hypothetical protein n=1 Tax=Methanosarcina sp. WH1 TaxID=1434102 RepID=UPI000615F8CF|nr:hypothetical protein [Methanosarcina sp. WH1]AKB20289.1 arabinose efflux permease [Methanosarcina sp. WH1]